MDKKRLDELLQNWRRHDRRRRVKSNVIPFLFGMTVWSILLLPVILGVLVFAN